MFAFQDKSCQPCSPYEAHLQSSQDMHVNVIYMDPVQCLSAAKRHKAAQRDKIAIAAACLDWCVCVSMFTCVCFPVCAENLLSLLSVLAVHRFSQEFFYVKNYSPLNILKKETDESGHLSF